MIVSFSLVRTKSTYIDGNQLDDEMLKYMPRLNKFIFSINTEVSTEFNGRKIDLQSNEDIRNSFIKRDIRNSFIKRDIQSFDVCSDDKLINNRGSCHVYSLPYQFDDFLFMGNCFHGGRFDKVRLLSMYDEHPFENKLFFKIFLFFKH